MDLLSLIQACSEGLASGGVEALGAALATSTVHLLRRLRKSTPADTNDDSLIGKELSDPHRLLADLSNRAELDPDFRTELEEWAKLAKDRTARRDTEPSTVLGSNCVSGISCSGTITISQSISGRATDER